MYPLLSLLSAGARRVAWSLFGASLATAYFALRASPSSAPRVDVSRDFLAREVHVHVALPPTSAPLGPDAPTSRAELFAPSETLACERASMGGGVYRGSYGVTYVTREYVDQTLENQADLMRSSRIVPESENGAIVGVRLFGVTPGSLLGKLGFENGDSLRTVEGYSVARPEQALEAYAKLRNAAQYHVQVVRLGRRVELLYRIC